jgi:hypothetical protein
MRGSLFGGALALALLAAGAASAQPNVAGVWHVNGKIMVGSQTVEADPTCNFIQNGAQISGACTGRSGSGPIRGVVSGNAVDWTWQNYPTGSTHSSLIGFNGNIVNAALIQGTMTAAVSSNNGTFTQYR